VDHFFVASLFHALNLAIEDHLDAFALEAILDDLRGVRVLAGEDLARALEDPNLGAEPTKGLGEFAADWSRADHGQSVGTGGQVEDVFVIEVAGLREAWDRRRDRSGAGGDHRFGEFQAGPVDVHLSFAREACIAEEDVDAELFAVALGRIFVADSRADLTHALHGCREIRKLPLADPKPERFRGPGLVCEMRAANHRLRGHTADVQAIAAHQVTLDEGDLGAQTRGDEGRDQPACARSEHDEVVAAIRDGVGPISRVDVADESLVELVPGLDLR